MSEELYNYLSNHFRSRLQGLKGFNALGNELSRTARYKRFIKEINALSKR